MKLDRYTARALVEANLMPLSEYIELFGSPDEIEAGEGDGLAVSRLRSANHPLRERILDEEHRVHFH